MNPQKPAFTVGFQLDDENARWYIVLESQHFTFDQRDRVEDLGFFILDQVGPEWNRHASPDKNPAPGKGVSYAPAQSIDSPARSAGTAPEAGHWVDADERKPGHSEDVLVWHCLGDRSGCDHAYDVACWHGDKWIFPWDRGHRNNPPQWVVKWMEIPRVK